MKTSLRVTLGRLLLAIAATAAGFAVMPNVSSAQAANPYPAGKSTFWAWQNRPDLPSNLGEAKDWASNAASQGWPVSAYPRPFSIAVYQPGVLGADGLTGHVAVVKQVYNDGSYLASQMDESDCAGTGPNCGRVNTRVVRPIEGVQFIHYLKDTRTTWGFAGGAAGWAPLNMDQGIARQSGWSYRLLGGSPELISPRLDVPLDNYNAVEVDMVIGPAVTDASVKIGFATDNQARFLDGDSVKGVADGILHTYHLSMAGYSDWKGRLTALCLYPAGQNSSGTVRIDRVRLVHEDSQGIMRALTTPADDPCRCGRGGLAY